MTRGSEGSFQQQRGTKRNLFDQHRGSNKRDRTPSIPPGSPVTLMHYFNKMQAGKTANTHVTTRDSISIAAVGSTEAAEAALQRDLERAIALSLEQETSTVSNETHKHNAYNASGTAEGIAPEAAIGIDTASSPEDLSGSCHNSVKIHEETKDNGDEKEKSLANRVKDVRIDKTEESEITRAPQAETCPICHQDIGARDMEKMNLHINRCLDVRTQSGQPQPATADGNSSAMAGGRHVFTPKDTNVVTPLTPRKDSVEKKSSVQQPSRTKKVGNPRKPCPYHKWMEDTKYTVDAFSYGKIPECEGYFLSHYHSDHYQGLSKTWSHGPIYCSKVTANLVKQELDVAPGYVLPLSLDEKHKLSETVSVTLIDANHCPGSVLFLFEVATKEGGRPKRHLHTGDFRASPRMCVHPAMREGPIDNLYLDTTYLDGHYSFPGQEEVVDAACDVAESICSGVREGKKNSESGGLFQWFKSLATTAPGPVVTSDATVLADELEGTLASFKPERKVKPRVLIVVGTYTIGKEKVFFHLAKRLNFRVFVKEKKRRILECQENSELSRLLTDNPYEAQIHVAGMWDLKITALENYRQTFGSHFSSVLAFRPTGWTFGGGGGYRAKATSSTPALSAIIEPPADRSVRLRPDKASTSTVKVYGIPYSEHSSFRELAAFVCSLDIVKIIPTVNMTKSESQERQYTVLNRWQYEKKVIGIKSVPYPCEDYW